MFRKVTWGLILPILLSGCAYDESIRQDLADSIGRVADAIVEEITDSEPSNSNEFNRLVKKTGAYNDNTPVYAADGDETIAENSGNGFLPIVAQIVYDTRGADRRRSEGELESLDRTELAALATSAEEFTGHDGYIVTYLVDDVRTSYFFDDIAVNELTEGRSRGDSVVQGFRMLDPSPERTYHDLGRWRITPSDGGYMAVEDVVFGYETRPAVLQDLGSATYEGWWRSIFVKREFRSPDQTDLHGSMTLNADLSEGEISGLVSDLFVWPSSLEDPDRTGRYLPATNKIVISDGQITDSRFGADWEVQDENGDEDLDDKIRGFSGKMLGAFYGPNGEEIAGVITGTRNVSATTGQVFTGQVFTGEVFARGSFSGVKSVETCLECP